MRDYAEISIHVEIALTVCSVKALRTARALLKKDLFLDVLGDVERAAQNCMQSVIDKGGL